ncbi:NINE protein [Massilia sp. YIM B02769]|uniref:NINE protein n=1 Tax=unclassified Massilia TaxID=2609279 RepID=UPI0025B63CA4|nr:MULTISPECIES: NINE protein [unclassified Massilia]MDN4059448.1 NINE protein [Massilia sp. YIM B02769]
MPYKNKTLATVLALALGGLGAHRFYLHGGVDRLGLLHACSLPVAGLVYSQTDAGVNVFYALLPLLVSYIVAFIAALAIGLTPDEKWDARFNAEAGRRTQSNWILAVLLVATLMVGATVLIATISRLFDLMYTGGAYG